MKADTYNQFLSQVRTSGVVATSIYVTSSKKCFTGSLAGVPVIDDSVSIEVVGTTAILTHHYQATIPDSASDEPLLIIAAQYAVRVELEQGEEFAEGFLEVFSQRQLVLQSRPYFRELVTSTAPRFNVLVPYVPSKFVRPVREIDQSKGLPQKPL
jgi:hypothetical protein